MPNKNEFIGACGDACDKGTFVTPKHDASNLATVYKDPRSVNCMGNPEMAAYLRAGDFRVRCYAESDPKHSPELYVVTPNDPSVIPGSGVPGMSSTPTTECDVLSVPSGAIQGWHGYAYNSSKVSAREASGDLTLIGELI